MGDFTRTKGLQKPRRECAGQSNTLARIQVVGHRATNVRRLNLVEEDIGPAIVLNGGIELELRPHELATLRIELG